MKPGSCILLCGSYVYYPFPISTSPQRTLAVILEAVMTDRQVRGNFRPLRTLALVTGLVVFASVTGLGEVSHIGMPEGGGSHASLTSAYAVPDAASTRALLEGAVHSSEFVEIAAGRARVTAFVSYPDRADQAPAVVVTTDRGMTDWARSMAFQAARAGFVAIAPDYASADAAAHAGRVRGFIAELPAANGADAALDVRGELITARVGAAPAATFALNDEGWATALAFVSHHTGNHFHPHPGMDHVAMELRAQQAGRGGAERAAPGLNVKPDDLPANWVMAGKTANTTPRKNEWIDIPMPGTNVKIHTWVVYPDGTQPAGTVLVLHGASGISDWIRSVADQLAKEGFIALAIDMSSGLGPNGGNFDSFRFMDDLMRASQKLTRDDVMGRIKAVRDFAAKMPRSNGRTGSIGFCGGGTNSFTLATDVPAHNASVVYYGAAPMPLLEKTTAPVIGFYGEDDARIIATVEPTRAAMKKLGKAYEAHTYPHATHSFLWMQDLGNNFQATADSWPRTIAFFRQHLATGATR
jgi:carboxymethylenebutenolidase